MVNYCLVYRTSETKIHQLVEVRSVNYYLDYGTSEPTTDILDRVSFGKLLIELRYLRNSSSSMKRSSLVNYCLIYGTSETRIRGTFKKRG